MIQQSTAKIFLSEERGLNETTQFRSRQTFNFGNYFNEHKGPVEDIYVVNDDTLDGGCSLRMLVQEKSWTIVLPVIGAVAYNDSQGNENLIAAGQVQLLLLDKGTTIEITNPFKENLVNVMQVWIKAEPGQTLSKAILSDYYVNEKQNALIKILPDKTNNNILPFSFSIGKFNGRGETVYQTQFVKPGVFVFVLEGAFEAEGRLLHARDGLALWNTATVDMEALSNDAIILLAETSIQKKSA